MVDEVELIAGVLGLIDHAIGVCGGALAEVLEQAYRADRPGGKTLRAPTAEAMQAKLPDLSGFDGILVKGSRSARMDVLSDSIKERPHV